MITSVPRISAIIPLYNGEKFIEQALHSVFAQSAWPYEVIVVDDGSTDNGVAVVEEFAKRHPVRLLRKPNGGQSSARNFGIRHSTGTLIALLDQDDLWYPDHLIELIKPFGTNQPIELGWSYSNLDEIDEAGDLVSRSVLNGAGSAHPKIDLLTCLRQDMFVLPSASLISRTAFDAVGGFDERLSGYEDDDLFLRMFSAGYPNVYINQALTKWRIYSSSTSFSPRMSASRMIYARKLVDTYPDDTLRNIFYARDLIVPRFLHQVVETGRRALRVGKTAAADRCRDDLALLQGMLDESARQHVFRTNLLITVVIPLRNGAAFIEEALRSVLEQTLAPDEIIVADDGSTDGGPDIVARFAERHPITLLSQPAAGRSAARNLAVRHAHGDLIAFLDPHDSWYASHLEDLAAPFRQRRARMLGWTYGNVDEVDADGSLLSMSFLTALGVPHPKANMIDCLRQDLYVPVSAAMVARSALDSIGGFDERLQAYEDDDLFTRLLQAGYDNVFIDKPLGAWRDETTKKSRSPEAAAGRMAYARKLLDSCDQNDGRGIAYGRDLILPRFLHHVAEDLKYALRNRDARLADICRTDLEALEALASGTDGTGPVRGNLLVTVVIPLRNGAVFIEEALRSVLEQTLAPDEIIVADDGSTDGGPDIVARFAERHPITLLRQPAAGRSSARNLAVRHAHGDLIAFLDPHDSWYASHLEDLAAPFRQRRARMLGWTYGNVDEVDADGDLVSMSFLTALGVPHPKANMIDCLRQDLYVPVSAAIVARSAFDAIGGFDERLQAYEDDDLFTRLLQAGYDNVFIDKPLGAWRDEATKKSRSPEAAAGRMAYARKLLDSCDESDGRGIAYGRDLILPRFLHHVAEDLKYALRNRDAQLADACKADLDALEALSHDTDGTGPARGNLLVSVVIPLYNGAAFIAEALRSVLEQTLAPDEIIVVDDGSTDGGPDIVARFAERYPVTILNKPNGGQSSARNLGVKHAHGDLIALLDQDDAWYPSHLAELVRPFRENRSRRLGWTYSNLDEVDRDGELVAQSVLDSTGTAHPKTNVMDCLRQDMFVLPSASVISRKAFLEVGGFDERLSGYEDDDLFIRLLQAGYGNMYIRESLSRWRIYAESTSFSARMARSRMIFARKLVELYPDEKLRNIFYARDLIVPRFLHHVTETMRRALRAGDMPLARNCVEDISVLESMVPATDRPRLFRTNLITSVVVVLHDGAATIAAALNSVLEQTHTPDEIIVVDDGSGDAGLSIVLGLAEKNAITVVSQPGRGTAAARNHGVRLAHGDLIAFLDHDDAWYPTHLATLTEPFRERRGRALGWSYSDIDEIDIRGELVTQSVLAACESVHPKTNVADCLRRDLLIPPSAAILSRHAFDAVGGFDESLTGYEDDDLFTRLLIAGYDSVFFETALTRWRRAQDDRQSRRMAEGRMAYARKLMEAFPDDEEKGRRYTTDLIAPRFAVDMLAEARKALSSKEADPAWIDRCFADLHYLDRFLDAPEGSRFDRRELVISAIIPLYNGAAFIEEALRSVFAQTLLPDEVIVVDDGSTDNGAEIVRRLALTFPIRLLQQKNSGQSAARNSGVDHSHGDLIAFLDQDDIWYPNHLAELVKPFLQEHGAELAWSYSDIDEIDEAGSMVVRGIFAQAKLVHPKRDLITCLSQDMFVLPSATLISRHAFQKAGGFDERLSGYEDDDLFLRLFQAGYNSVFLPEPLSKWRIFQSSSSFSPRMAISRLSYARMLIDRFPDDLTRSLYYTRDLIAPRFFRSIAADLRRSIINKNDTQRLQALSHLAFITGFLRWYLRIPFTFFLLPLLRIPFLAKMLIHYRRPLANVLRRIL